MASGLLGALPPTQTLRVSGKSGLLTASCGLCIHTISSKQKQGGEEPARDLVVTRVAQTYVCLVCTVLLSGKEMSLLEGMYQAHSLGVLLFEGSRGHWSEEKGLGTGLGTWYAVGPPGGLVQ